MHDICPFSKNPSRENLYSAKREQFMCAKNPCFTVVKSEQEHGLETKCNTTVTTD